MNKIHLILRFIFIAIIGLHCGWSNATQAAPVKIPNNLEAVVQKFSDSYILGTGAKHFVTSIKMIDPRHAVAVIGETSHIGRDANAYTVYAKQIKHKWKIVKYEFVFYQTREKGFIEMSPPFPYPHWEKDAP
jgi:hypothetical protein